jgi:hypothetical protein
LGAAPFDFKGAGFGGLCADITQSSVRTVGSGFASTPGPPNIFLSRHYDQQNSNQQSKGSQRWPETALHQRESARAEHHHSQQRESKTFESSQWSCLVSSLLHDSSCPVRPHPSIQGAMWLFHQRLTRSTVYERDEEPGAALSCTACPERRETNRRACPTRPACPESRRESAEGRFRVRKVI